MKLMRDLQMLFRRMGRRVPSFLLDKSTREMRRLANTMSRQDTVLDFGAHVGNATTEFAQRAKHVHAFEANPAVFRKLQQQTRRYRNVTLHNKAISDANGTVSLFFEDSRPGRNFDGSTIMPNKINVSYENKVEVEAMDIAEFMVSLDGPVACIKMDIEGAEYRVLDRLIETHQIDRVGKLYVECHTDRIPGLAEAKEKTIAAATKAGVLDKLDLTWD